MFSQTFHYAEQLLLRVSCAIATSAFPPVSLRKIRCLGLSAVRNSQLHFKLLTQFCRSAELFTGTCWVRTLSSHGALAEIRFLDFAPRFLRLLCPRFLGLVVGFTIATSAFPRLCLCLPTQNPLLGFCSTIPQALVPSLPRACHRLRNRHFSVPSALPRSAYAKSAVLDFAASRTSFSLRPLGCRSNCPHILKFRFTSFNSL